MKSKFNGVSWKWVSLIILIAILGFILISGLDKFDTPDQKNSDDISKKSKITTDTNKSNGEILEFIKNNIELGMSKEELKEIIGEVTVINPSESIIPGYGTTEVWRYDFTKDDYIMNYDEEIKDKMIIDKLGIEKGDMKTQLFIEWSKGENIEINNISVFYYKKGEIYEYNNKVNYVGDYALVCDAVKPYFVYKDARAKIKEVVELSFNSVPIQNLEQEEPKEGYTEAKVIQLDSLNVKIHLFVQKNQEDESNNDVFAFLESKGNMYSIGQVSYLGLDNISVKAVDRTLDGDREIEIIGDMGASYSQIKLIKYNNDKGIWKDVLTMGSPRIIDLDSDGKDDLIGVSMGSTPSYLEIYFWNEDHFEKCNVNQATDSISSYLYEDEEGWIIKTVKKAKNEAIEKERYTNYYSYKDRNLLRLNYNPEIWITKPIVIPKFNGETSKVEKDEISKIKIPEGKWQEVIQSIVNRYEDIEIKKRFSNITVKDFYFVESWIGELEKTDFQLDVYSLDASFILVVEKYGDEIRTNIISSQPMTPFLFYGDSVNLMMVSKGTNRSFNIKTGNFESEYPSSLFEVFLGEISRYNQQLKKMEFYRGFNILGNYIKPYKSAYIVQ
ncbi:MAG: hypothetical protein FH761_06155 [Firmicutes bacterium]|nr:hypothetical protein [Bacillota bacterium]